MMFPFRVFFRVSTKSIMSIWQHLAQEFVNTSYLEWFGFVTTIACVYLAAKQNIWNWPTGIASVVTYMVIFYQSQLFGDAGLQIYFLGTSIYGWYFWIRKKQKHEKPVTRLSPLLLMVVLGITGALALLLGWFLQTYTPSKVPYIDGFCTSVSFMAQLLMTRKIIENWALWVFVDICYIPLYIYKSLYLTSVLYVVLLILATLGYIDWRKEYRKQTATTS